MPSVVQLRTGKLIPSKKKIITYTRSASTHRDEDVASWVTAIFAALGVVAAAADTLGLAPSSTVAIVDCCVRLCVCALLSLAGFCFRWRRAAFAPAFVSLVGTALLLPISARAAAALGSALASVYAALCGAAVSLAMRFVGGALVEHRKVILLHPFAVRKWVLRALRAVRWARWSYPFYTLVSNLEDSFRQFAERRALARARVRLHRALKLMGIDEREEERRTRQAILILRELRKIRVRYATRQIKDAKRAAAVLLIQRRFRQWPGRAASLSLRAVRARASEKAVADARAHGLLLRPNTRFVMFWRLFVVLALVFEGAQLLARWGPVDASDGYVGSWDRKKNEQKVLNLAVHPACLPPDSKAENKRLREWRRSRRRSIYRAAEPPPPPPPPPWCDSHARWLKRRIALAAAPTVGIAVTVVASLDVPVMFFTGRIDPESGLLAPMPAFQRWVYPGLMMQLAYNPSMVGAAGVVRVAAERAVAAAELAEEAAEAEAAVARPQVRRIWRELRDDVFQELHIAGYHRRRGARAENYVATLGELRVALRARGLPTGGRKSTLNERLVDARARERRARAAAALTAARALRWAWWLHPAVFALVGALAFTLSFAVRFVAYFMNDLAHHWGGITARLEKKHGDARARLQREDKTTGKATPAKEEWVAEDAFAEGLAMSEEEGEDEIVGASSSESLSSGFGGDGVNDNEDDDGFRVFGGSSDSDDEICQMVNPAAKIRIAPLRGPSLSDDAAAAEYEKKLERRLLGLA